jgi:hypothetical protein
MSNEKDLYNDKVEISVLTLIEIKRAFNALRKNKESYINKTFSDDYVFYAMDELNKIYDDYFKNPITAREYHSPIVEELLNETTPEQLKIIDKQMSKEQMFEEWQDSLGYSLDVMIEYLNTAQSYIDFADYYHKKSFDLPVHFHEGVENIYVCIENGVINVKLNK